MPSGSIAFLLGILALQAFKELPEYYWLGLLCLLPLSLTFISSATINKLLTWLVFGFIWAWLNAWWLLNPSLPANVEGKNVQLTGYIASIPETRDRLVRFKFDVITATFQGRTITIPGRIRLNWYGQHPQLQVGDKWEITVRLKRPHGFMNPGGFDYEKWLFSQGIGATGYVRHKEAHRLLQSRWVDYPVQRLRQTLLNRVRDWLPDSPVQGIVSALVLGYRNDISQQQWEVFRQTGTNHLVAISGLHIGLVATVVFFLGRLLWCRFGGLTQLLPAPQAAALMAFMAATAYAAMAGWSLPTQRALIMLAVVMVALFFKRHILPLHGFSLALILVLVHDPLAVLSPGLWLSFGAVGLIFMAVQGKRSGYEWWNKWIRVQWAVGLGLLPILVLFFQQGSLVSPVANFIAVPVVSLLVVPLLLSGVVLGSLFSEAGQLLLETGAWVLTRLSDLLGVMGASKFAIWSGASPETSTLLLATMGMVILLFAPVRTSRWLGLILLLPLVFYLPDRPNRGEVYFTLLDVGQGLAAVIQTHRHVMVFDTGPRLSESFDTGSAVVAPYLRQQQIRQLDLLLVSHGDNDHIGGASSLLATMPVKQILSSAPKLLEDGAASMCERGLQWRWDEVKFRILHPDMRQLSKKENNQSCVLHVQSQYGSILLPGDIEREAELALLGSHKAELRADILVAPHHGSKTSSTRPFIEAVNPKYVLFPVGYRNRYRFPSNTVVQRYRELGVKAYDTASAGAIQFRLNRGKALAEPKLMRRDARVYWHHAVTD